VRKTINDMVPKTIMSTLVNKSKNTGQHVLIQKLFQSGEEMEDLLNEDKETKIKR